MNRTFQCAETAALDRGERIKDFVNVAAVARRKLRQFEIADRLEDLGGPPGNRTEALKGDRVGQHGICVNDPFRVCFRWAGSGAEDVGIVDFSRYRRAEEIGVPAQCIGEIVAGTQAITADSDLRLCRFFGLSNGYWLRAQAAHHTELAERTLRAKRAAIRPWAQKAGEKPRAASRS